MIKGCVIENEFSENQTRSDYTSRARASTFILCCCFVLSRRLYVDVYGVCNTFVRVENNTRNDKDVKHFELKILTSNAHVVPFYANGQTFRMFCGETIDYFFFECFSPRRSKHFSRGKLIINHIEDGCLVLSTGL